jgi:hypothetical protein
VKDPFSALKNKIIIEHGRINIQQNKASITKAAEHQLCLYDTCTP